MRRDTWLNVVITAPGGKVFAYTVEQECVPELFEDGCPIRPWVSEYLPLSKVSGFLRDTSGLPNTEEQ